MASPNTQPLAQPADSVFRTAPLTVPLARLDAPQVRRSVRFWEPLLVFLVSFAVLAIFTPRITTYLDPTTGDEPFYLMSAISLIKDGDLNECNNYIQHDELALYPSFYGFDENGSAYVDFPKGWRGWTGSPLPLPPHPALISPASRQCAGDYRSYPIDYDNPGGELYSKHGLGLSLLVLPSFALGGRLLVVFFLNMLGAILAANVYLLARESVARMGSALLTWGAFAFTVPQMPYSYLIFTELPAALLTMYAFRRIRNWNNNPLQVAGIGLSIAFLPWLHYRFAPLCLGLAIYYIFQLRKHGEEPRGKRIRDNVLVVSIVGISAILLMLLFYTRYGTPWPNGSDHAGISDVAGTMRGAAGLFLDQQWGLLVASPIFILALVGLIIMGLTHAWRRDLIWIAVVTVPYFLLIANYAQWWGEWCPPGRYLLSILPLFALPFAVSLDNIKGIMYRAIYGVLLLLSLLTMWGFLYQPQWMYNQPVVKGAVNGKSELLMHGFTTLGAVYHQPFLSNIDLTGFFPSFVSPYFAYYQGPTFGDAAAAIAWRTSFGPLAFISLVVFLSLLFAYLGSRRKVPTDTTPQGGSAASEEGSVEAQHLSGAPASAPSSMAFRRALRFYFPHLISSISRLLQPRLQPAFAYASISYDLTTMRFQTDTPSPPVADSANGHATLPTLPDTVVQAPEPQNGHEPQVLLEQEPAPEAEPKPKLTIWDRIEANPLWRSRGLWLGLAAVGITMYAQKLTTVDRDIINSIHWYALAIFLMLIGWLGTYKDRSFLVVPVERVRDAIRARKSRKGKVAQSEDAADTEPARVPTIVAAVDSNGAHEVVEYIAPLPVRKKSHTISQPLDASTLESGNGHHRPEEVQDELSAMPLPVRVKPRSESATPESPAAEEIAPVVSSSTGNPGTRPLLQDGADGISGVAQVEQDSDDGQVVAAEARSGSPTTPLSRATAHLPRPTSPLARLTHPLAGLTGILSSSSEDVIAADAQPKTRRRWLPGSMRSWWRYSLAITALILNLYCAGLIRADYYSAPGTWGWLISLFILLGAFLGERKPQVREVDPHTDVMEETDVRLAPRVEFVIFISIFLLGLGLRLLNLGEWTTGMHGDEGEAGMDAIAILEGNRVSPFLTGWFAQPNFYYWGIALTMKVFGTDLFGLRMFSALMGSLMLLPFYPMVKMWFGIRTAIIASLLLAFSDVAIHFSKAEFSNITTPTFLVAGFYFLFKGLRFKGTIDFVLAGYMFMLSMYFYLGGRLTPFMLLGIFAYMFVLMPILRLPGTYRAFRRLTPTVGRLRALRDAVVGQGKTVVHYFGQMLIFGIACICFATPWLVYYFDHQQMVNERTNEKLIFSPQNVGRMAGQYGATHDPLYLGVRMPAPTDVYSFSPIVFENTPPATIKLSDDGFWPRVIWGQLTTTLSLFTYRFDASSVYTFTGEPVTKPIEAALLILGLAWALWRWRDTRMAIISAWFWSAIIVGGVLTIDAPYMARIVGLIPVMAILIALPLSKLAAEFMRFANIMAGYFRNIRFKRALLGTSRAFSASIVGVVLLYLGLQNYSDYFQRYSRYFSFAEVTGQSLFVHQMNDTLKAEGKPTARYYDLGLHFLYWGHGDNRFLNHGSVGDDMQNGSNDLPILDNGDRDAVFMVWPHTMGYMDVLRQYYPDGIVTPFPYGANGAMFTSFHVTREMINARRVSLATYTPASGDPLQRQETGLGISADPPAGLQYPVQASWTGGLDAPQYGRYKFALDVEGDGQFIVDGTPVLTTTAGITHAEGDLLLARGVHDVELRGSMQNAKSQVQLQWYATGIPSTIPRQYLWYGPGKGLIGEVRQFNMGLTGDAWSQAQATLPPTFMTRIDGYLGFRNSPGAISGGPFTVVWKGDLTAPQDGNYNFESFSNGDSVILIDDQIVVDNEFGGGDAHTGTGQVPLTTGRHTFELRYTWNGAGTGYLEVFWTRPDGLREMLGPNYLHTSGGIVDPAHANEPGAVQLAPPPPPEKTDPDKVMGSGKGLLGPRGLGVDRDGNVYIGDRGNHRVAVLSPDGEIIRTWGKASTEGQEIAPDEFTDIVDVATGADGRVYVMDIGANRLQVFDPQGKLLNSIPGNILETTSGNGIAVGPDGRVYIADTASSRVRVIGPITEGNNAPAMSPITGGTGANKLDQPVDVVVDPTGSGKIYVADLKNRVVEIGADGNISREWHIQVGVDTGGSRLAISKDGSVLYMSDPDRQRVDVIELATAKIKNFGQPGQDAGQFGSPQGIAVGADGRIYVLDRANNDVQVFTIK